MNTANQEVSPALAYGRLTGLCFIFGAALLIVMANAVRTGGTQAWHMAGIGLFVFGIYGVEQDSSQNHSTKEHTGYVAAAAGAILAVIVLIIT